MNFFTNIIESVTNPWNLELMYWTMPEVLSAYVQLFIVWRISRFLFS